MPAVPAMNMDEFGTLDDGRVVHRLVIGSAPGPVVHLLTLGAIVHRLEVTGGDGVRRNVALAHPSPADYLASTSYVGAVIGRYANRIAGGRLQIDGVEVQVGAHERGNHLHGGPDGFDRRLWTVIEHTGTHAVLGLESPHGDQGFPGDLSTRVRFEVQGDRVGVSFEAVTGATTVVNLTSHVYLNLEGAPTIEDHVLQLHADLYTPVDLSGIPLAGHASVAGTPFDFRAPTRIGTEPGLGGGIDHNVVVRGEGLRVAAVLESPRTRTRLELLTDQPGLQVYTGSSLEGLRATDGGLYRRGGGIALEPQLFPDSPNHPEWPSAVLAPGETYRAELAWQFSTSSGPLDR